MRLGRSRRLHPVRGIGAPLIAVLLAAALASVAPSVAAGAQAGSGSVQIFGSDVVRSFDHPGVGANVNFFTDDDALLNPATPLHESLSNMGGGLLRFPGGEKSDNYLWSVPPYTSADPHFAITGSSSCVYTYRQVSVLGGYTTEQYSRPADWTLDFDEFMTVVDQTGAEPFITVSGDAHRHVGPAACAVPTLDTLVENAAEWVRYANVTNDFDIRYWMVGNESWNQSAHAQSPPTPVEYVADFIAIASAMKAVDPTITVVANTQGGEWVQALIDDPVAAGLLDAVGISSYAALINGWPGYQTNQADLDGPVSWLLGSIQARNTELPVFVYEYSPIDFSGQWPTVNDLGHALATLDMYATIMANPEVEAAALWNTRWFPSAKPGWQSTNDFESLFTAINPDGELEATALALSLWGSRAHDDLLRVTVPPAIGASLTVHATASADGSEAAIYVINRGNARSAAQFDLVDVGADPTAVSTTVLRGDSSTDASPEVAHDAVEVIRNGSSLVATFPPVSITVIDVGAAAETGLLTSVSQSCVNSDGRFVIGLTNRGSVAETTDVLITRIGDYSGPQLPPRQVTVPAGASRTTSLTGRADGVYRVRVRSADPSRSTVDKLFVGCDNPPPPPNASVGVSCLAGNGRIDVDVTNDGPAPDAYAVAIGALTPRERTIAAATTTRVTATGRPDGPIVVRVSRSSNPAAPAFVTTVTVNCDSDGVGDEPLIAVSCLAGNGRVDITVANTLAASASFSVDFGALPTRTRQVAAGASTRFTITGRPDGPHDVVVRRGTTTIAAGTLQVACDG